MCHGNVLSLHFQVHFSFHTSFSFSPVESLCFFLRRLLASSPVKGASPAGERLAHSLRVFRRVKSFIHLCSDCRNNTKIIPIFNLTVSYAATFPVLMWCPVSYTGLGYGTQVIVCLLNFYYIIVLAWAIFYFYFSFSWDLPWSSCNNTWNTGKHTKVFSFNLREIASLVVTQCISGDVHLPCTLLFKETCVEFQKRNQTLNITLQANATSPVMEFWE